MTTSNEGVRARWAGLGQGVRFAAIGVGVLVASLAIWLSLFAFREQYGVLFSNLTQADAAAIVTELKARKIGYRLQDQGTTIVVPQEQVHEVRLQLMSSELPLNGGVGFEIFDKQGLGATESSQRVSFQRALQGELSRTIATLEHVKSARVHLVLPESSLFTKDRREATAAVTLLLERDAVLQRQQILGVQRLIAASVPGLTADRVVITNHRGETMSLDDEGGAGAGAAGSRLDVKRSIEEYVTRKVARLLDSAYGPGQAIVTVDAALSFDAAKRTIQDLVPVASRSGAPEGMVVRRRQVMSGSANDSLWETAVDAAAPSKSANSSVEVEYEYGKRMEEVISAPGAVTRLTIGVIVPATMSQSGKDKIADIVRAAAGIDETRGDVLSVQTLRELEGATADAADTEEVPVLLESTAVERPPAPAPARARGADWTSIGLAAVAIAILLAVVFAVRAARASRLSSADRERLLRELQATLDGVGPERTASRP